MSVTEILRRLRRLVDMPQEKRPVSVSDLERVAGLSSGATYVALRDQRMTEKARVRFEHALTRLENDQIHRKPAPPRKPHHNLPNALPKGELYISAPKPQQVNVTRVSFKTGKPRLEHVAVNPKAFPDLDGHSDG